MIRKGDFRTDDTERDWATDGLAIGSPNDPAIGEAYNQTTGPGGKGLMKPPKDEDAPEQHTVRDHIYNG
jgi:hypothetical protein